VGRRRRMQRCLNLRRATWCLGWCLQLCKEARRAAQPALCGWPMLIRPPDELIKATQSAGCHQQPRPHATNLNSQILKRIAESCVLSNSLGRTLRRPVGCAGGARPCQHPAAGSRVAKAYDRQSINPVAKCREKSTLKIVFDYSAFFWATIEYIMAPGPHAHKTVNCKSKQQNWRNQNQTSAV
jgi:hypothetical protein